MILLLLIISTLALGLAAACLYKIRKVHLLLFEVLDRVKRVGEVDLQNHLKQVQNIERLHNKLNLPKGSLPSAGGWTALPDLLLDISERILSSEIEEVLECGSGISTVVSAQSFKARFESKGKKGKVFTLEHNKDCADVTRRELSRLGLESYAEVIDAPLVDYEIDGGKYRWYSLDNKPWKSLDLLFVDGPPVNTCKHARFPALPLLEKDLSSNLLVILDDGIREEEKEISDRWLRAEPKLAKRPTFFERGAIFLER
jgi:predicted O-methyltransferase YrrM